MNKYTLFIFLATIAISCNGQKKNDRYQSEGEQDRISEAPKGAWKVNKEFDDQGNLIRYDSIYSWSSNKDLNNLSQYDRDSILNSMQSRFYEHFSDFDLKGDMHGDLFSSDSLFTKRFFDDSFFESEFGEDFMDIDQIREHMRDMQEKFLEKYESEFRENDETTKKGEI